MSDRGSNFTSQLLRVHPSRTTPHHLQTDRLVERFTQTLKAMLRKNVSQTGLPTICIERISPCKIQLTFELLYGWAVRGSLDILKRLWGGGGGGGGGRKAL